MALALPLTQEHLTTLATAQELKTALMAASGGFFTCTEVARHYYVYAGEIPANQWELPEHMASDRLRDTALIALSTIHSYVALSEAYALSHAWYKQSGPHRNPEIAEQSYLRLAEHRLDMHDLARDALNDFSMAFEARRKKMTDPSKCAHEIRELGDAFRHASSLGPESYGRADAATFESALLRTLNIGLNNLTVAYARYLNRGTTVIGEAVAQYTLEMPVALDAEARSKTMDALLDKISLVERIRTDIHRDTVIMASTLGVLMSPLGLQELASPQPPLDRARHMPH